MINPRLQRVLFSAGYRALPLAILLLAILLRLHRIDYQSLWNDEGNSLRLAERSLPALITAARLDIHPPGYYMLLKGWLLLTGDSELALRLLSALAGVLTVACVLALGQRLFSSGAGILAALLVAVNSFSVYYSQEARMYALLGLLAVASMLAFLRWSARPSWRIALALALLNAAGLYTQYTYPFVMVTQGVLFVLWWLSSARRSGRILVYYVLLNVVTLALFAPQLGTALAQATAWPRTGQSVALGDGLTTVARWLIYGNTAQPANGWWVFAWPTLFMLVALLPDWLGRSQPSWWRRALPWLWLLVTVGPLFGLGLFREANLKFLLPAQIATALLLGRGLWLLWEIGSPNLFIVLEALPRLAAGFGLLWLLSASSDALSNLYDARVYARPDYRAIARLISAAPRLDDAVILDAPNQQEVFSYYYNGTAPVYPLPVGLGGDDAATHDAVTAITSKYRRIFAVYWGQTERDPNTAVEHTLAAQAFEVSSTWYNDVRLVQYATLPPTASIDVGIKAQFGESITLNAVHLSADKLRAGDVLGVSFDWRTAQPLTKRYKVFVQLLDTNGQLVAQHDSEPGNNLAITTSWQPDKNVLDTHGLLLPLDLSPGQYQLIAGLYDSADPQARMPVNMIAARVPQSASDHIALAAIQVVE